MPRSEKSPQCTIKLQCYCDNQARWAVSRLHTQRQLILQDCNYKALINYTMITFITSTARQPRYCLFFTCQKIVHCVCVVSLCSPAISVPFVLFYLWLKKRKKCWMNASRRLCLVRWSVCLEIRPFMWLVLMAAGNMAKSESLWHRGSGWHALSPAVTLRGRAWGDKGQRWCTHA